LRVAVPYRQQLEAAVGDVSSILDVGCGEDSPLRVFGRRTHRVGVDAYEPAIERSRAAGIHDEYRVADILELNEMFAPNSFEAVVAFDVLEHLEQADGLALLDTMERIATRRVVILTPNGFVPQSARGGNPWQVHHSGWTAAQMRGLGYTVSGVHGLRYLRSEEAAIRWKPERFWHLASDLTEPLTRHVPSLAYQIIAVKSIAGAAPPRHEC
jgi:2-polyprenyl-3-methyl-5-hydroxy-6-metoxy-1,4-benzoquinol methylase